MFDRSVQGYWTRVLNKDVSTSFGESNEVVNIVKKSELLSSTWEFIQSILIRSNIEACKNGCPDIDLSWISKIRTTN